MKEKTCLILRSNIISDYLKGMKVRHIIRKYSCSPSTACKWIKYYREKKKQEELNKEQITTKENTEHIENNFNEPTPIVNEEINNTITINKLETKNDNIKDNKKKKKNSSNNTIEDERIKAKFIMNELDKMDLSRKKAKRKPTSISQRIQNYLYKQFSNKRTGGKDNILKPITLP